MARVSTYLNFMGNTAEAFEFYKSVFGTDYVDAPTRMGDAPPQEGMPEIDEAEKDMIMHVALPILAGHVLMGTDMIESMGQALQIGNNTTINLEPDSLDETQRLYAQLSDGGSEAMPLQQMFWGAWWGTCLDRFGIRWMFNYYIEET